jgi:hypothetical protein
VSSDDSHVAVIAIHGVGQHSPGASASAVSTLLMNLGRSTADAMNRKGSPPYPGFTQVPIEIPLRPVMASPQETKFANERQAPSLLSRIWHAFDERRGFLAVRRKDPSTEPIGHENPTLRLGEPDRGEFGYQFMLTQVAGYQGDSDRNFSTDRLEAKRARNSFGPTVHIYDAHYADLSKPQNGFVAFFFAFYQLLFHLASLGLQAVYWAETENLVTGSRNLLWRIHSSIYATAVRLLIMWIPLLNLILFGIVLSSLVDKLDPTQLPKHPAILQVLAFTIAGVVSLTATFWLRGNGNSPRRSISWLAIPIFGTVLGVAILWGLACLYTSKVANPSGIWRNELAYKVLLLMCWLIIAGAGIAWIAKQFSAMRPGAFGLGVVLYILNSLKFLLVFLPLAIKKTEAATAFTAFTASTASVWMLQWIFAQLAVCWGVCLVCAFLAWPLGAICIRKIKDHSQEARAIAAFRTGRFAFALSAMFFLIVTCGLWSSATYFASRKLHTFDNVSYGLEKQGPTSGLEKQGRSSWKSILFPDACHLAVFTDHATAGLSTKVIASTSCDSTCQYTYVDTLVGSQHISASNKEYHTLSNSDLWYFYLKGLLLLSVSSGLPITVGLLVFALFALIWTVLPSVIYEADPESTVRARSSKIRRLGEWLSRGIDSTAILVRLLWLAIVVVPLVFVASDRWNYFNGIGGPLSGLEAPLTKVAILLIEGLGLSLIFAGASVFTFVLKVFGTVLDTVLDVDNYLRTSPKDSTPRAKIAERITSLLRYIAAYRDEQGRPYSKLIIVAHSLGGIVTTDLLRYLHRSSFHSPDPDLTPYGFGPNAGNAQLPIRVFTMGCPLRQALNRFFPQLYWWVSDVPENSDGGVGAFVPQITGIQLGALPRTDEMCAALWSNAYRSGDYVGRSLWSGQWLIRNAADAPMAPPDTASDSARSRLEMCIGLGAHTHYWDRSAQDVAAEIDRLILLP